MDDERKDLYKIDEETGSVEMVPYDERNTEEADSEAVTQQIEGGSDDGGDSGEYAPYGVSYRESDENKPKPKKLSGGTKSLLAIIASLLVIALIIGCALNLPFGKNRKTNPDELTMATEAPKVKYTYVLVHGLGGWGDNSEMSAAANYWGATAGSIENYLEGQDYNVVVPTVGPFSSTWDRTCELYAQLTGTKVDYGEAHSEAHGHDRYGTDYSKALVPEWSSENKINLIGHSFGGETARMLASLMAYGSESEKNATGSGTSPLFTGGKGDWIFSVTTLASPHNGSQLTEMAGSLRKLFKVSNTAELMADILVNVLGSSADNLSLMLGQFGINDSDDLSDAIKNLTENGTDHAFYELSPDGAAELNKQIKTVSGVYYLSYAWSAVTKSTVTGNYLVNDGTYKSLYITASALGNFKTTTDGGIVIDSTWFDNDGLVSVVSASYPTGADHCDMPSDASLIKRGIWNVAAVSKGDHGTPIGLDGDADSLHAFYDSLLAVLENLER